MAVKIGHASINEYGKVSGGAKGNQKKELNIRTWYSKPWDYLLRCNDATTAENMARMCEIGINNKNIGYDQPRRNTAYIEAKKHDYKLGSIDKPCDTDCSAFMTLCAIAGGVKELEYKTNAPTTSTMKDAFKKTGKFTVITDKSFLTSDAKVKRGDILVKAGSHTVMVLEDGSQTKAVEEMSKIASDIVYYPKYVGNTTSIVSALQSLKIDSNIQHRKKIGAANGIDNVGTVEGNTIMLNLLKQGKLIKA